MSWRLCPSFIQFFSNFFGLLFWVLCAHKATIQIPIICVNREQTQQEFSVLPCGWPCSQPTVIVLIRNCLFGFLSTLFSAAYNKQHEIQIRITTSEWSSWQNCLFTPLMGWIHGTGDRPWGHDCVFVAMTVQRVFNIWVFQPFNIHAAHFVASLTNYCRFFSFSEQLLH